MTEQVEYIKGESIPFRHGFFTRNGGFSKKEFAGLNVSMLRGDEEENVLANRAMALKSLNLKQENFVFLNKLDHGSKILHATSAAAGKEFDGYDVVMTNDSSVSIGLCVADCVPVIVSSEEKGAIMVIHAGWRGLEDVVVQKAVVGMCETFDINPAELKAVIGPHIRVDDYEYKTASKYFESRYVKKIEDEEHLDLTLMTTDQLTEAGVDNIEDLELNTFTDERFFSVRREGIKSGRFLVIASL